MRSRASRLRSRLLAAATVLVVASVVVSCASPPDPDETRESLTEVTADPTPPEADLQYDAELHPEPIVDALECDPYLVITARGTGEPVRKQLLGPLVRAIDKSRPDEVQHLDLDYPAGTDVKEGGTLGARMLVDTLNVQFEACPEQNFVLLGYSQGALIIGDALTDPEYRLVGTNVGVVMPEAADRVIAVVLYGNPRFVGSEPYGVGSFNESVNGLLPRPPGSLDLFADRLRDYCVALDFVCQTSLALEDEGHIAYYENGMQADGAAFVITRMGPISDRVLADKSERIEDEEAEEADPGVAADGDTDTDDSRGTQSP